MRRSEDRIRSIQKTANQVFDLSDQPIELSRIMNGPSEFCENLGSPSI